MSEVTKYSVVIKNGTYHLAESDSGTLVLVDDYATLQQKLEETEALMYAMRHDMRESREKMEAMLAENVVLKERERRLIKNIHEDLGDTDFFLATLQTPATDAILNEVRAEGVEMFAAQRAYLSKTYAQNQDSKMAIQNDWVAIKAQLFAAQLRASSTEGGV